jgi:5-methylcytosine-specific restriction endonuclease McrA
MNKRLNALMEAFNYVKGERKFPFTGISKLLRKNGKCAICESTKKLVVHHKDRNHSNNNLTNLIVLCRSCHNKEHK